MITPFGELPDRLAADMTMAEQHEWLQRRITRRSALRASAAGAAALSVPFLWTPAARAAPVGLFNRLLTYGADPTTQMIVRFATTASARTARVDATSAQHTVSAEAQLEGSRGTASRFGRSELNGLDPGDSYRYTVTVDGAAVGSGSFSTASAGRYPFRFTAFGDQGVTQDAQALLKQLLVARPQLHLFAGDISYADSSGRGGPGDVYTPSQWDLWLRQNDTYTAAFPWMFAMGNHEMEPGFDLHGYAGVLTRVSIGGSAAPGIAAAASYRVSNVGFVALDSNDVSYEIPANLGWTQGAQTAWLKSTLASMRSPGSGIDFIVAYMHHAPYSTNAAHGSEGGIREHWVPLFDQHSVDLVISGHNHCYERTLPLRDGKSTTGSTATVRSDRGTTYIVAGGGGQLASPTFQGNGTFDYVSGPGGNHRETVTWSIPTRSSKYAFLCIDVTPPASGAMPTMHIRALDEQGGQLDDVLLSRPASGTGTSSDSASSPVVPIVAGSAAAVVLAAAGGGIARARVNRRRAAASDAAASGQPGPPGDAEL